MGSYSLGGELRVYVPDEDVSVRRRIPLDYKIRFEHYGLYDMQECVNPEKLAMSA